jgi:type II secretion system protein L
MMTRLFVRLHRDASVPASRCEWILRDSRGAELRRGQDTLSALPKAGETVAVITHDLVVTRALSLPPGRRARTPIALANAMEPFLLSEPASNHVVMLGEARDGASVLAAIARAWLDPCLSALAHAGHAPALLIVETSLLKPEAGTWIAVCLPEGGFLRLDDEQTFAVDATSDGGIPEGVKWQMHAAAAAKRPFNRLRIYHHGKLDYDAWQSALGVPIEDAGRWDWAQATSAEAGFSPRTARNILAAVRREQFDARSALRVWRTPALGAALILGVHVGASVIHWSNGARERSALQAEIRTLFRKAAPPSAPLVDALVQTRRALGSAQRISGQYARDDFVTLLGRVANESAGLPANAMRTIQYRSGTLSTELRGVPVARIERMAEQLRSHGLRVEISTAAALTRMTVRSAP